jgi:hypothetical protein
VRSLIENDLVDELRLMSSGDHRRYETAGQLATRVV